MVAEKCIETVHFDLWMKAVQECFNSSTKLSRGKDRENDRRQQLRLREWWSAAAKIARMIVGSSYDCESDDRQQLRLREWRPLVRVRISPVLAIWRSLRIVYFLQMLSIECFYSSEKLSRGKGCKNDHLQQLAKIERMIIGGLLWEWESHQFLQSQGAFASYRASPH